MFWNNKPLEIGNGSNVKYILSRETLLENIKLELLTKFKISLKCRIANRLTDEHIRFIQKYYFDDPKIKLYYSKNLLMDYLNQNNKDYLNQSDNVNECDFIILELRSKQILIGLIIAKKITLNLYNNCINSVDINYLCLNPNIRHLNLAPFLITKITLSVLETWDDISSAFYTVGHKIHDNYFSEKNMYHIPINNKILKDAKFIINDHTLVFNIYKNKIVKFNPTLDFINSINLWYKDNYVIYEKFIYKDNFSDKFIHLYDGKNYMCLYQLDNICNGIQLRTGYVYKTNFKEAVIFNSFIKYIKDTDLYDLVNTSIYFNTQNLLKGTGTLYYYAYNLSLPKIESIENGLVTI